MNVLASILITFVLGLFAGMTFILAQHKKEIWNNIKFKEEGDTIERTREPNTIQRINRG